MCEGKMQTLDGRNQVTPVRISQAYPSSHHPTILLHPDIHIRRKDKGKGKERKGAINLMCMFMTSSGR